MVLGNARLKTEEEKALKSAKRTTFRRQLSAFSISAGTPLPEERTNPHHRRVVGRRQTTNSRKETHTVMPSLYVDPTQFLSPEERERALVNFPATREYEAALAEEKAREKEEAAKKARTGGPRTAEGKARSSRNAVKHGFAGANPVISCEDQDAYNEHLDSYVARFQPADQPEADTVRRAAIAMWRLDRLYALETIILNLEASYHAVPSSCILPPNAGPFTRSAVAFRESAGDGAYDLCRRYIQAATREHDRAIRTFYLLESKRSRPAAAAAPALQPKQQNKQEPNELPKTRPHRTIESLVNPYPSARNTAKPAATSSDRRKLGPKVA